MFDIAYTLLGQLLLSTFLLDVLIQPVSVLCYTTYMMRELRSFSPVRRSLDFVPFCSDMELPSNFYEYHFSRLGAEICTIVLSAFSPKEEHQAPRTSPWLGDYPEEFIRYVELVAHMDARAGKWDRLLRDRGERTNLLQAIIFKALDNRVFSRLLFGASSKHDETLHNSDVALITAEGM